MRDSYTFEASAVGIIFEIDRLRRERNELIGELSVKCSLVGAHTVNGYLTTGDFNFSSVRARQDRAKLLGLRANANGKIDFFGLLEDVTQQVFKAEREGDPAIHLRDLARPSRDEITDIDGFVFPKRHSTIIFGDGGSAKSYFGLYVAGKLTQAGLNVGLFDWELAGEDHRDRLERLFGPSMPDVIYCRCEQSLSAEADRLSRIVREHKLDYCIYDSIAFACDGPPETAEIAARYFRAVRQVECGSLHLAHITKAENNNDQRPFGSAFWHNGARSTWYIQAVEPGNNTLRLGLYNRKANLGPLQPAVSYVLTFTENTTEFRRVDMGESPELSSKLSVRTRILLFLRTGARTVSEIAVATDAEEETIKRTIRRYKSDFIVIEGGLVGLLEKHP
jgi:hypothetical protein